MFYSFASWKDGRKADRHLGVEYDTFLYIHAAECLSLWSIFPFVHVLSQCHSPHIEQNIVAGLVQWKGLKLMITYGLSSSNGLLCLWEPWLQAKLCSAPANIVNLHTGAEHEESLFLSFFFPVQMSCKLNLLTIHPNSQSCSAHVWCSAMWLQSKH